MTTFVQAMTNTTRTENGMKTHKSSFDTMVDLFFKAGASRGSFSNIRDEILECAAEDLDKTVRLLLWLRDAREGAGERQLFRDAIRLLISEHFIDHHSMTRIVQKTIELGRFDDILSWHDTNHGDFCLAVVYSYAFGVGNALAAKWCPRKGPIANKLRKVGGLTPKEYRKGLVERTNVVETQMCAKQFSEIDFAKVPSVAMSRYLTAFHRNAPEHFQNYKQSLIKGETKVNASAVYPHTIVNAILHGGDALVATKQWESLPNYLEGNESKILPVVDTSGSMNKKVSGSDSISCMEVAIALGIYIAERNEGTLKDHFLSFSQEPTMHKVTGRTLKDRVRNVSKTPWGFNTNLERVFETVLENALAARLAQNDMPDTILILSDMQFDKAVRVDNSAMEMIEEKYGKYGYLMPRIVFWNMYDSSGIPTQAHRTGAALVSGFSPSIMKSILATGTANDPRDLMLETIMNDRYRWE